jgi:hypothetical protein
MDDRERQLEAEGAARTRVAIYAIVAGVLYLAGEFLYGLLISAKTPTIGVVQGLVPALRGQQAAAVDPRTIEEQFLAHHTAQAIVIWVVIAVGLWAMRWPLLYLREAEMARGGRPSNLTGVLASYASPVLGVAVLALAVSIQIGAHHYLDHTARDSAAVNAATGGPVRLGIAIVAELAQLGLAIVFVLVSLRAMRVGLLTRLIGSLGIIAGVLFVISIVPIPLVQFIWLLAVGLMFLQPGGQQLPPAWAAGEAIPWVNQAADRRAQGRSGWGGRRPVVPAPAPSLPVATPAAAAAKKRKRRRR